MTRYDLLGARRVILSNVRTDTNLTSDSNFGQLFCIVGHHMTLYGFIWLNVNFGKFVMIIGAQNYQIGLPGIYTNGKCIIFGYGQLLYTSAPRTRSGGRMSRMYFVFLYIQLGSQFPIYLKSKTLH